MTKDDQLRVDIEEALNSKLGKVAAGVNVQIEKGYVKLLGMVDTLAEGEQIAKVVQKLPHIKGVDNSLTVAMENLPDDEEIEQLVAQRFMEDSKLDINKIGADCEKGVVILRGQASSLGEIEVAQELATQIAGVREVRSLVKFTEKAKEIDDATIVNGVELAFSTSVFVDGEDIDTSCENGAVKLEGIVDNDEQKEVAEVIAKTVPGVRKVFNNLNTRHDNSAGDNYLTNQLRKELNKSPRVSPAQVKVYVKKNTAYLSGQVYSIESKKSAEEVARDLKGIDHVVNDIQVKLH